MSKKRVKKSACVGRHQTKFKQRNLEIEIRIRTYFILEKPGSKTLTVFWLAIVRKVLLLRLNRLPSTIRRAQSDHLKKTGKADHVICQFCNIAETTEDIT